MNVIDSAKCKVCLPKDSLDPDKQMIQKEMQHFIDVKFAHFQR